MTKHGLLPLIATVGLLSTAEAQGPPDTKALIAAQREAMARLAYADGIWRGPAWTLLDSGQKHTITQTERIGPFLNGSVKVIEGRGYDADGTVSFNAFGTISYDSFKREYTMHSYAQGFVGDFVLKLSSDGYVWEIPAGPGTTIRYTAVVKAGEWHEVGDRITAGKEPVRVFDMSLTRVGDTNWPAAGAVSPMTK